MRRSYLGEGNPFYGRHHSKETCDLLSAKASQRLPDSFIKTKEHKEKISLALKGKKHSPEHIEHNRLAHIGQMHTQEWKAHHSQQLKGRPISEEHKNKISKANRGKHKTLPPFSEEHRRKIGEANRRRWRRPGFADKVMMKIAESVSAKPNKAESLLDGILQQYFPNEWKFTGDGKVIIAKKKPDFINCNGRKLIIELFGNYWHTEDDEEKKRQAYQDYGFRVLFVWETELSNVETLIKRIKEFVNEPSS